MTIILFGYRGCGKTTVGRLLAAQLGKPFVDVDEATRRWFALDTIAGIWRVHGEAAFREREARVTEELLEEPGRVIALGGGTLMQPSAQRAVERAENARRFYLWCEPAELYQRIQSDAATTPHRPNLTPLGGGIAEIEAMLEKRDPIYRAMADEVVDVTFLSPAGVVERCG